jgi:predicted ABC-type ATPase
MFLARGAEYFNPDEAATRLLAANPGISQAEASSAAWNQGRQLLERAIAERLSFAFETTLGGHTFPKLLDSALSSRLEVRIWYVGLSSPELHNARVRARVRKGGHDIAESTIRDRYDRSRFNLIHLLPRLTELRAYDNSEEADPDAGAAPEPVLLLRMARGKIVSSCKLKNTPQWAKPILAAAIRSQR